MSDDTLFSTMPSPGLTSPRDGGRLSSTRDILFLSHILRNARRGDALHVYRRKGSPPLHLLGHEGERPRRPVDGTAGDIPEGYIFDRVINIGTIRKYVRAGYYGYRHLIEGLYAGRRITVSFTIRVDGRDLYITEPGKTLYDSILSEKGDEKKPEPGPQREALLALNEGLAWKLDGGFNIELALQERGMPVSPAEGAPARDALCPLDGPVRTIDIELVSPRWTWHALCGRHWTGKACPLCMGVFFMRLSKMS